MTESLDRLESLFAAAMPKPPAERAAFLDQACGDDPELRRRVDDLLRAQDAAGSFLAVPDPGTQATLAGSAFERPGAQIGHYKLLQQIGEGGFGVVFMAEQTRPVRRKVALKVIKPGMDTRQVIARFEAERQALAMMDHPNIARVLDAGTTESGRPYFVMELVRGAPITTYCDENNLPIRERLILFATVCQAIQHAHTKGIIHRDIKPSNVLVTRQDGQPRVKVIDFGVAKAMGQQLTEKTLFTEFAQMIGTPLYMSPEQAELSSVDIDTRSDVYSLGVLLYELLTGTTPVDKEHLKKAAFDEIRRIIRDEDPPKPSTRISTAAAAPTIAAHRQSEPARLTKLFRGELDWIVMRALEKDRNRRYETANGFAMDLQRYLADEPVLACPPSAMYRVKKFARRNKVPAFVASLLLAVLMIGIVGTTWGMFRATIAEAKAAHEAGEKSAALSEKEVALADAKASAREAKKQEAQAKKQEGLAKDKEQTAKDQELLARRRLYASQINLANQAWEAGNTARVLELLEGLRPRFDEEDLRSFEWYYLWRNCYLQRRLALRGHAGPVTGVAFSPDGKSLASAGQDVTVRLWDPTTGSQKTLLRGKATNWFDSVRFTPDGQSLAASRWDGTIELWDANTGQPGAILGGKVARDSSGDSDMAIRSIAISPDGRTIVGGSHRHSTDDEIFGVIKFWDMASGQAVARIEDHQETIMGLAFSPDGKTLASASGWGADHGIVLLWDVDTKTARLTLNTAARDVAFSPDGALLALGHGGVTLHDVATGRERGTIPGGLVHSLCFSPDGKTLAAAGENRTVWLADVATGTGRLLGAHLDVAYCVAFSPDGRSLASGGADGAVNLWHTEPVPTQSVLKHSGAVLSVAFAPNGKTLVAGGHGPIQLWDMATETAVTFNEHSNHARCALAPDGKSLAVLSLDAQGTQFTPAVESKSVKLWDLATGEARGEFRSPSPVSGAAYSADGKTLATWKSWGPGVADVTIRLWDVDTQKIRVTFQAPYAGSIICAAFSPDGKTLVAGAQFNSFVVWDLVTSQRIVIPVDRGHSSTHAVVFSPDGKTLAAAGGHGTVRLWDVERWQLKSSLKGHTDTVGALVFSPDGNTLITGSIDTTIRFWDVITGQERMTLKGHNLAVASLAFAPDGNTLASGGYDQNVMLWRATTEPEATARRTELDPDDRTSPRAQTEAANRLWLLGHLDAAEQSYRKALARLQKLVVAFPTVPAYRDAMVHSSFNLSLLLASTGRPQEAEDAGRQAVEQWQQMPADYAPSLPRDFFTFAEQRLKAGAAAEAQYICSQTLTLYQSLFEHRPKDMNKSEWALVHNQRGYVHFQLGHMDKARDDFTAATELHPAKPVFLLNLATTYLELKQHDEAIAHFRKAIDIDVSMARAYDGLTMAMQAKNDLEGVIATCLEALEALGPGHAATNRFQTKLANAYESQGKLTEALRVREQALAQREQPAVGPNDPVTRANIAQQEMAYARAIEQAPTDAERWLRRAHFRTRHGNWDGARTDFLQAVDLRPDDLVLLGNIAGFYCGHNRFQDAAAVYDRALERDPANSRVKARHDQLQPGVVAFWNFDADLEGWAGPHECLLAASDGVLKLQTTGGDPWVIIPVAAPGGWNEFTLLTRTPRERRFQLYWTTQRSPDFAEERSAFFTVTPEQGEWVQAQVRFQADAPLTELRLDPIVDDDNSWEIDAATLANVDSPPE